MPSPVRATRRDWCGCACASGRGQSGQNSSRLGHCAGVYRRARLARVQFCLPWSHAQVCSLLPAPRGHRVSASSSAFQHPQDAGRGHGRRASLITAVAGNPIVFYSELRATQFYRRVGASEQHIGPTFCSYPGSLVSISVCACVCACVCCDDRPLPYHLA